ncbi:MAG: tripartite tricarboxylate transporter TctB family protein [Clostridia bacterium]|nr:tripartite tricarboxylate transporter TctB family protein [Clostridia bacterium]MBR5383650.1 tripartite tricarboxylate transporter TctB family protein [Clostridia bacterium]
MAEIVFNGLLLIACIVMAIVSTTIPIDGKDVLARYWPMGIMIVLIVLLVIKLVNLIRKLPKGTKFKFDLSFLKEKGNLRLFASFVLLFVYAALLPYGGYILTTILFCLCVMWLLGARKPGKMILGSVCITVALFIVFCWGLRVSLPRGYGPLEQISKWLEYLV